MKVLIVVPALGAAYGGPSKSVVELAQALSQTGVSVDLVTTNANGSDRLAVPLNAWIVKEFYRVQYFSYWHWGDYKLSLPLSKWLFQHAADYDLVHINAVFSLTNLPAYWACHRRKVPYAIAPRGMLEPWALSYKAWKKKLFYRLFEQPALAGASAIHALNHSEAQGIKALNLPAPLIVIPNGIRQQDFELLPDPEIFYRQFPQTRGKQLILFLGRVDPKKGLDLLAAALAQVKEQLPEAHLIVAGPDNVGFLPAVKNYFQQAGCGSDVTFTGLLSGTLKYAALAAASVYVAPSYSEGFSMSVLEGMASGLPCIITTGCNFPEAAEVARVVNIDAAEIAAALISCLSHPQQAKNMGDRARKFILEKYTWNRIAADFMAAYQAILPQPPISTNF